MSFIEDKYYNNNTNNTGYCGADVLYMHGGDNASVAPKVVYDSTDYRVVLVEQRYNDAGVCMRVRRIYSTYHKTGKRCYTTSGTLHRAMAARAWLS